MTTPNDGTDPPTRSPAEDGAVTGADGAPSVSERRERAERRTAEADEENLRTPPTGTATARTDSSVDREAGRAGAAERRNRKRRQRGSAAAASTGRANMTPRMSRRRESMVERRQERQLTEKRRYWSSVRREVERLELDHFLGVITQLAQHSFGPSATAVPHLRGKGSRGRLIIVVDAAHPEAATNYDEFLPLEQQFWTAFGTIAKPTVSVTVAVRPARGWLRNEERAPVYTQFGGSGFIS